MNRKLFSLLSIAKKAGRISLGHDVCIEDIQKNKSALILLTDDCSERSAKDVRDIAQTKNVQVINTSIKKEETSMIFRKEYAMISINDEGFAKKAMSLLTEE